MRAHLLPSLARIFYQLAQSMSVMRDILGELSRERQRHFIPTVPCAVCCGIRSSGVFLPRFTALPQCSIPHCITHPSDLPAQRR
jgi:hypothetical protein